MSYNVTKNRLEKQQIYERIFFLSGSSYFIMECLEGDSYAAIKQKLTEEEQQTIDCVCMGAWIV